MAKALKVYDASEVSIIFLGFPIDSGFDDGEFCSIEQNAEDYSLVMGTDGEGTRSASNNRSAKVTIKLMQSSSSNELLSAANNLDRISPNGAGVGVLLIRDRQGTSLFTAQKAWLMGPPKSISFDREAKGREWVIETNELERFDGGN